MNKPTYFKFSFLDFFLNSQSPVAIRLLNCDKCCTYHRYFLLLHLMLFMQFANEDFTSYEVKLELELGFFFQSKQNRISLPHK